MGTLETKNTTKNGMTTNSSSLNECVNLFFSIGAMRGKRKEDAINLFSKAFNEDPRTAMKILFWSRDIREGAGERQIFRDIISFLVKNHPKTVQTNLDLIPEYGRWDDTHVLFGTELENGVISLLVQGLKDANGLCAKWLPRKGLVFNKVRKSLKLTPKELRKLIVSLSNTIEQKMCSKRWSEIEYPKTPSLAMARYTKAFGRNDGERFSLFIESLKKGEVKINSGALYPYDITKTLRFGDQDLANEQWKALPNWMENSNELILPVVDVSGSMDTNVGGNKNLTCMEVAISLGIYISERNHGVFKDMFVTFSSKPKVQKLLGNLTERYNQLSRADWGYSTDLKVTFQEILQQAVKFNIPQDQMPTKILILSDMQFNAATSSGWGNSHNDWNPTAMEMIDKLYDEAGYTRPGIIFWNLNDSGGNFPASFDEEGTCLISGFSPSIMKSVVSNPDSLTPINIMNETINSERYEPVTV
jgi:hypothetical protein